MANQVCRSSGVLGSSAIVNREQSLLISIHANLIVVSNALVTVKVFDGTSASGTEVARITHSVTGHYNFEYDMHGVLCRNGIFLEIVENGSSTAEVSVEFA
jgi:hypothetical protein|tara:strand:+ start:1544 stop:1846 length:303 start_codon:yes stop_codon:yes gene_type:complete